MIKNLQIKFIVITMSIVFIVFAAFSFTILLIVHLNNSTEAYASLDSYLIGTADYDSFFAPHISSTSRAFVATVYKTADGEIEHTCHSDDQFSSTTVKNYILQILNDNKTKGRVGNIYYIAYSADTPIVKSIDTVLIAAIDRSIEAQLFKRLTLIVLISAVTSLIVIFFTVFFLSFIVVKPAKIALTKQKQFISDAGHELKTPATVIIASSELLKKQIEDKEPPEKMSKWVNNIHLQTEYMSHIVKDLLCLSKIDENREKEKQEKFDLSTVVNSVALSFEVIAFEAGKSLEIDLCENVKYYGNKNHIVKAVSILLENAVLYSPENGKIIITLEVYSLRPILSVFNTCSSIDPSDKTHLFSRFFRSASSRSNSSGSGLGLSILKSLAQNNCWTINTEIIRDESIKFSIDL